MNPYEKYQRQMVNTMTQGDLLNMLFDGAVKQIEIAKKEIDSKNLKNMDIAIGKARKIIQYLKSCLDFRYSISHNLSSLYSYFDTQLGLASVKKSVMILDEIGAMLKELRETFTECDKVNRSKATAIAGMNQSIGANI